MNIGHMHQVDKCEVLLDEIEGPLSLAALDALFHAVDVGFHGLVHWVGCEMAEHDDADSPCDRVLVRAAHNQAHQAVHDDLDLVCQGSLCASPSIPILTGEVTRHGAVQILIHGARELARGRLWSCSSTWNRAGDDALADCCCDQFLVIFRVMTVFQGGEQSCCCCW